MRLGEFGLELSLMRIKATERIVTAAQLSGARLMSRKRGYSVQRVADVVMRRKPCNAATFYSASFSKPNPIWFGKVTPKKYVGFSKPIPVWFGKKKNDFARRRFQTKFRLVWKF